MNRKVRSAFSWAFIVILLVNGIWITWKYLKSIGQGLPYLLIIIAAYILIMYLYWILWGRKARTFNQAGLPLLIVFVATIVGRLITHIYVLDAATSGTCLGFFLLYELKDWPEPIDE